MEDGSPGVGSSRETTPARRSRADRLEAITALAATQDRVVSRAQLRGCWWTGSNIDHEIRVGRWRAPTPSVVVLHNGDLTYPQQLWLGVLHAGADAALSHLTAARRAGLDWAGAARIDVITTKGHLVPHLPGYYFHQTRRPYRNWLRPVAGPPRLPIEHAALLTAERDRHDRRAVGILAAAVQQRLTTADRLLSTIPAIRKLRHKGLFGLVLGDIAGGAQSFAEIDVGHLCREAGLEPPTRQAVRVDKQGRRRYLDCEWTLADGRQVVLEVDGGLHAEVTHWWQDMKRERAVVVAKRQVLRCASVELRLAPADIIDDLRRIGVPRRSPLGWVS